MTHPQFRAVLWLLTAIACLPHEALAYRPFDNTDAATADAGEFELELGPLGYLREGAVRSLVAPAVVANWGISGDREIVLQGQGQTVLGTDQTVPRTSVTDTGLFLKQVLRRGVLQDQSGLSVAMENGFLLPEFHGQSGTGLSSAGIVSGKSDLGAIHFNTQVSLTRDHHADLLVGSIFEGPDAWTVRPVAELWGEQERTAGVRTFSKLIGGIWRVNEQLSFDIGIRQARTGNEPIHEVRLGLTWSFSRH
jgi:hypothetical protein